MPGDPIPEPAAVRPRRVETALTLRAATPADALVVHALYEHNPAYFENISIPLPSPEEVAIELAAAQRDERRVIELVTVSALDDAAVEEAELDQRLCDRPSGGWVVGYLDYKLDYPEAGDATVNLLLVHGAARERGVGRAVVRELEARLSGRVRRLLASIYGRNLAARRFWEGLGYRYAIDARPVVEWYGKALP